MSDGWFGLPGHQVESDSHSTAIIAAGGRLALPKWLLGRAEGRKRLVPFMDGVWYWTGRWEPKSRMPNGRSNSFIDSVEACPAWHVASKTTDFLDRLRLSSII
jgi:hypothetical protein